MLHTNQIFQRLYWFISILGLFNFHTEANAIKLWIPSTSDFAKNYEYLWDKYPPGMH